MSRERRSDDPAGAVGIEIEAGAPDGRPAVQHGVAVNQWIHLVERPNGNGNGVPVVSSRVRHPLFLRWVVLQSVVATLLVAAGVAYAPRLGGASLAMVPLILAVLAGTSAYAGLLAWRADAGSAVAGGLRHLWFAAGVCQLLGLLGTVAGFYAMFNDGGTGQATSTGTGSDLASRVTHGAGVALSATFIGILSSIVILLEHHVLDREE